MGNDILEIHIIHELLLRRRGDDMRDLKICTLKDMP